MEYRRFGRLDFEVSAVGFGCAAISGEGGGYGFGEISEADAIELVHSAQDLGINLFDTAPIYGFGMSEQRLGKALRGARRDGAFIVTKCGIDWDDKRRVRLDNSPETTRRMIEQSLRDLQTEQIDLYLVHWPDSNVDIRSTMEVMVRAQEEGKLAAIGLSNTNPDDLAKAQEIGDVAVCQGEFNLFQPWMRDNLFESFDTHQIGFMSWGTLEKGILTGRVTPNRTYDKTDVRSHAPWWTSADHSKHFATMERIVPLLRDAGHTGLQLALTHNLNYGTVSTALCGARNRAQLEGLVAALERPLADDLLEECRRIQAEIFAD